MTDLTPREIQVLEMLADGMEAKEVSRALNIATTTVQRHAHNVIAKLGAKNIRDAARIVRERQ